MKCKDIVKELADYLDEALDPCLRTSIEEHLGQCKDCRVVVDTTKQTIEIFCNSEPAPLPSTTRQRLHDALIKRLRRSRPGSAPHA
ncbi:MAG TPA: zf-HC2 domain-containing protein [Candidatus Acidoferrum sp.]|nr:zf-HC2 domain-containing protein [Candidatus Acidoferrum sp.]